MANYYRGEITNLEISCVEAPTRLSKQLTKLGKLLVILRGHDEITDEDYRTLQRVAKDTAIPEYQMIVDHFIKDIKMPVSDYEMAKSIKLHNQTTRNKLYLMQEVGIVDIVESGAESDAWKGSVKIWRLSDVIKEIIEDADLQPATPEVYYYHKYTLGVFGRKTRFKGNLSQTQAINYL